MKTKKANNNEAVQGYKNSVVDFLAKNREQGNEDRPTIYSQVVKVNAMGTRRHVKLYVFINNTPLYVTWLVAQIMGYKIDTKTDGIISTTVGMDVGFEIVYNLSCELFGDGYAIRHERF